MQRKINSLQKFGISQKKFADIAVPFWSGAQMSNAKLGMAHAATLK